MIYFYSLKIQKNKSCLNIIALCGQFHYYKKLHGYEKINHNQLISHLNFQFKLLDINISHFNVLIALNYFSSDLIILVKL